MAIADIEDFAALRNINRQLVRTQFLREWNFRLDIPGAPTDFDFYVKDISYGIVDVATDEEKIGAATFTWPTGSNVLRCSFSVRDHQDGRIQKFFTTWLKYVFPRDGTVNTPFGANASGSGGYLKLVSLYEIVANGIEALHWSYYMYPTNVGETNRSRENGNFFEIPITMTEFSSIK